MLNAKLIHILYIYANYEKGKSTEKHIRYTYLLISHQSSAKNYNKCLPTFPFFV